MNRRLIIEVEVAVENDVLSTDDWDVIDAVYHVGGVVSVVKLNWTNVHAPTKPVELLPVESTRRPNDKDREYAIFKKDKP